MYRVVTGVGQEPRATSWDRCAGALDEAAHGPAFSVCVSVYEVPNTSGTRGMFVSSVGPLPLPGQGRNVLDSGKTLLGEGVELTKVR